MFRNIVRGLVAALTSTEVVKAERSLAALIVGRLLLAAGASVGVEQIVVKLIHG
jgi:hypothetical protein